MFPKPTGCTCFVSVHDFPTPLKWCFELENGYPVNAASLQSEIFGPLLNQTDLGICNGFWFASGLDRTLCSFLKCTLCAFNAFNSEKQMLFREMWLKKKKNKSVIFSNHFIPVKVTVDFWICLAMKWGCINLKISCCYSFFSALRWLCTVIPLRDKSQTFPHSPDTILIPKSPRRKTA